ADEPTGNLDSASARDVMALLRSTHDERGQTIVLVTHDARVAARADRVLAMRDGAGAHETRLEQGEPTTVSRLTQRGGCDAPRGLPPRRGGHRGARRADGADRRGRVRGDDGARRDAVAAVGAR